MTSKFDVRQIVFYLEYDRGDFHTRIRSNQVEKITITIDRIIYTLLNGYVKDEKYLFDNLDDIEKEIIHNSEELLVDANLQIIDIKRKLHGENEIEVDEENENRF